MAPVVAGGAKTTKHTILEISKETQAVQLQVCMIDMQIIMQTW